MFKHIKDLWVCLILLITTIFIWCYSNNRLKLSNWNLPINYKTDSGQVLGWIKASSEGDFGPLQSCNIKRLGAPYEANWNDYPQYDKHIIFILGRVAKHTNIFFASNVGIVVGRILCVLSFYICCRLLTLGMLCSSVGALIWGFTYFFSARGLGHLFIAYEYLVPFILLTTWWLSLGEHIKVGDYKFWTCFISAIDIGFSSPYNINIYCQLLLVSVLIYWHKSDCHIRNKVNLKISLMCFLVCSVSFLIANWNTLTVNVVDGTNHGALIRNYFECELYGLRPIELLIPPPVHHLNIFDKLGTLYFNSSMLKGESFSPYLGIVGIAGLLFIVKETAIAIVNHKAVSLYALLIGWLMFYSTTGGGNCILGLCGFQLFRGSNRYSIFISCIIILYLVKRLNFLFHTRPMQFNVSLSLILLLIASYDQIPKYTDNIEEMSQEVLSDQRFWANMESILPVGSKVFEMPVMVYPESTPVGSVDSYDMLRPYFNTKDLKFSFGSVKGRKREDWQFNIHSSDQLVKEMKDKEFSAIYINKNGFQDKGNQLITAFRNSGYPIVDDAQSENTCILLQ